MIRSKKFSNICSGMKFFGECATRFWCSNMMLNQSSVASRGRMNLTVALSWVYCYYQKRKYWVICVPFFWKNMRCNLSSRILPNPYIASFVLPFCIKIGWTIYKPLVLIRTLLYLIWSYWWLLRRCCSCQNNLQSSWCSINPTLPVLRPANIDR